MRQPKLRDSHNLISELYPLGNMPEDILVKIGAGIIYRVYTGRKDITGDDWGDILAEAVQGTHYAKPVGITDLATESTAWSAKTVKVNHPFSSQNVRLISGRNSPDFSYGIEDPHEDIQKTGDAVLGIWNGRVDIAQSHHPRIRVNVLLRNSELTEFVMYEEYLEHFRISDYEWSENDRGNLEGYHKRTKEKCFTWQPHGSQFTIHSNVPSDAVKFRLRKPPLQTQEVALKNIGFNKSWIEIIK